LREWGNDILELAQTFITRVSQRHRLPCKEISALGRQRLLTARWPGNVRELSHEIERAIVFESSEKLEFAHLAGSEGQPAPEGQSWLSPDFRFPEQGFDLEKAIGILIERALRQTGENVSAAARLLGVTRDYLRYRLAEQKSSEESGGNGTGKPEGGNP
jgi:DNA-binding NtrC family response regulator